MRSFEDLKSKTAEELPLLLESLQRTLLALRNERELSKKLEKPHQLRLTRKKIARLHTEIRERACLSLVEELRIEK